MSNQQSHQEYLRRIHKVQDYIEVNLRDNYMLSELADVSGFSKYHFHRIFRAMTQETLLQYVHRIKMERAAFSLFHRPEITVTDIAYHFGFSDSAVFSRAFKNHYGVSPTEYRQQDSKNCKASSGCSRYNKSTIKPNIRRDTMKTKAISVETKAIADMRVIYIRHTGNYRSLEVAMPRMMEELYTFAMHKNLLEPGTTKVLIIYHDNPEMTDEMQLRTSLCLTLSDDISVKEADNIGSMTINGKYAVGHFELAQNEYDAAWKYMYGDWLPNSGCQPRDALPFEMYVSDPATNPGGKQFVDIYLPIEPLDIV